MNVGTVIAILPGFDERKFFEEPVPIATFSSLSKEDRRDLFIEFIDGEARAYLNDNTIANYLKAMRDLVELGFARDDIDLNDRLFTYLLELAEWFGEDNQAYEEIEFVLSKMTRPLDKGDKRVLLTRIRSGDKSGEPDDRFRAWAVSLAEKKKLVCVKVGKKKIYLSCKISEYEKLIKFLTVLYPAPDEVFETPDGAVIKDLKEFLKTSFIEAIDAID